VFVVDDLVGWLIGHLADAGYHKLATLLRGSDQVRALKAAVTAAVQVTVAEIGPSGGAEADRVAEQINKAFRRRDPVPLPPGQPTLLEALQAGITGQLAVLDSAGQPVVSLPGVPVSVVAANLTGHLLREIIFRGSQPGPLTPLADQLNHDLTHLQGQRIEGQGQRIEGMLAQVLDRLSEAPGRPGGAAGPAGWPLAEVGDPFALEVHPSVESDVPQPGLPVLPEYVPREHDAALAQVVTATAAGTSRIAVLVGGSSTGKTRACWQALELLRGREPGWRLWHPVDPQAALAGLPIVGPRTVLWLNDAERYLDTADAAGEQVAARLRELLQDPDRGPVLALGTLWPEYWAELTTRPQKSPDPHAQARELLGDHDIPVPAAFTDEQLRQLWDAGDPRLAQAAAESRDGQVIQYLTGAPELLHRYRNASPAARALIEAAMDGRRLGMPATLSQAFLETAAPGYLTDTDWDLLDDDWLEEGLRYTKKPAKGVRGPLAPIRPRPAPGVPAGSGDGPGWQLADYLDQYGRRTRQDQLGPASLWDALTTHTTSGAELNRVAEAAALRGLYRHAAALWTKATALGSTDAAIRLIGLLLAQVIPGDPTRAANWAAAHARFEGRSFFELLAKLREAGADDAARDLADRLARAVNLDNTLAVASIMQELRGVEADDAVRTLLARGPATYASLDDPGAVAYLIRELRAAGADDAVQTLLARDPAIHASLDPTREFLPLLRELRKAGADDAARALADRIAREVSIDDTLGVASRLMALRTAGADDAVQTLLARDPATHASFDNLDIPAARFVQLGVPEPPRGVHLAGASNVADLLDALREAGADDAVQTLLARDPATHASLRSVYDVAALLRALHRAGADGAVQTLADRAAREFSLGDRGDVAYLVSELREAGARDTALAQADRGAREVSPDDPGAVASRLGTLRKAGADGAVQTLLARDPATHAGLNNLGAVAYLVRELREAGADDAALALADRAAREVSLDDPGEVADLLVALREAGADEAVQTLLARDPATHASLDHPWGVAHLARELREAGADDAVQTLLARDPATRASLDDQRGVRELLDELHEAGADDAAQTLAGRAANGGEFDLFLDYNPDAADAYRFGREPDETPSQPWKWQEPASQNRGLRAGQPGE
jgi:uncharacterized protein YidB (DUF937 family)